MSKEGFLDRAKGLPNLIPTPATPPTPDFDYSQSNLILMIGGQILIIVLAILILISGNRPITFPADIVRKMFAARKISP